MKVRKSRSDVLGNILGGDLFSDTAYSYLYLVGEVGVNIGFDIGYFSTAEEASSLMRNGKKLKVDINEQVLTGVDIDNQRYVIGPDWLSHSGNPPQERSKRGIGRFYALYKDSCSKDSKKREWR